MLLRYLFIKVAVKFVGTLIKRFFRSMEALTLEEAVGAFLVQVLKVVFFGVSLLLLSLPVLLLHLQPLLINLLLKNISDQFPESSAVHLVFGATLGD